MQLVLPDWETDQEFIDMIQDLLVDEEFLKLDDIVHHHVTTRYLHSLFVAYVSYLMGKEIGVRHLRSLTRGALLHDFFLETRQEIEAMGIGTHNAVHPQIALENAKRITPINALEADIILKHMFLCTTTGGFPKYVESYIVTVADKYCSIYEATSGLSIKSKRFLQRSMQRIKKLAPLFQTPTL